MTGYEKSPDYGDPRPDKGWNLWTWAIVYVAAIAAAVAWLVLA
jgi:hypothetical protein